LRTATLGIALAAGLLAVPAAAQGDEEPLARFEDPLCPGVAGLQVEAAEFMVGRIRGNAEALGLRLADEQVCEPNLIVTFVADGQGFFQRMRAERAYLFRDMTQ